MIKLICPKCNVEYRLIDIDITLVVTGGKIEPWPYMIVHGQKYFCPKCKSEVIFNFGNPIMHYQEEKFKLALDELTNAIYVFEDIETADEWREKYAHKN